MAVQESPATDDIHAKTVLTPPKKHISNELLELAKKASSATISAELGKKGFRFVYMAGVRPLKPGTVMAGRASTLRYLPRREDHNSYGPDREKYAEHVAIESLEPGDVLVVDARGNTDAGVFRRPAGSADGIPGLGRVSNRWGPAGYSLPSDPGFPVLRPRCPWIRP